MRLLGRVWAGGHYCQGTPEFRKRAKRCELRQVARDAAEELAPEPREYLHGPLYRVLVTGSRDWDKFVLLWETLDGIAAEHGELLIIHGAARGADSYAAGWAEISAYHDHDPNPADWTRLGKAAGQARNQAMVDKGADVCVAFYKNGAGNRGTADCVARAVAAGIPVRRIYG